MVLDSDKGDSDIGGVVLDSGSARGGVVLDSDRGNSDIGGVVVDLLLLLLLLPPPLLLPTLGAASERYMSTRTQWAASRKGSLLRIILCKLSCRTPTACLQHALPIYR